MGRPSFIAAALLDSQTINFTLTSPLSLSNLLALTIALVVAKTRAHTWRTMNQGFISFWGLSYRKEGFLTLLGLKNSSQLWLPLKGEVLYSVCITLMLDVIWILGTTLFLTASSISGLLPSSATSHPRSLRVIFTLRGTCLDLPGQRVSLLDSALTCFSLLLSKSYC